MFLSLLFHLSIYFASLFQGWPAPELWFQHPSEPPLFYKIKKEKRVFKKVTNHDSVISKGGDSTLGPAHAVKVVVIDSAFDPHVKGMSSKLTQSYLEEVSERSQEEEEHIHGAALKTNHANGVVDIIAGRSGICPSTQIEPFDVHTFKKKKRKTWDDVLVAGCERAIESGANFVNISMRLQCKNKRDQPISPRVRKAFLKLAQHGIVVFKSAGNDGEYLGKSPYTQSLVSLAEEMKGHLWFVVNTSYQEKERLHKGSNKAGSGAQYTLAAPGTRILMHGASGLAAKTGTSFSAPIVTGVAAKVKAHYPHLSNHEVAQIVVDAARTSRYECACYERDYPLAKHLYGQGVVNLEAALERAALKSEGSLSSKVKLGLYMGLESTKLMIHRLTVGLKN